MPRDQNFENPFKDEQVGKCFFREWERIGNWQKSENASLINICSLKKQKETLKEW